MLDGLCLQLTTANKNLLIPWFIMASYSYYEKDEPILTDEGFDDLTKRLASSFHEIEHIHKHLIDPTQFKTGYYLKYPDRIKYAVKSLLKEKKVVDKPKKKVYVTNTMKEKEPPSGDLLNIFF